MSTNCIGAFQEEHWKYLRTARFIPIPENQDHIPVPTSTTPPSVVPLTTSQQKKRNKKSVEAKRLEEEALKKAEEEKRAAEAKRLEEMKNEEKKEGEKEPEITYKLMRPNDLVLDSEVRNQFKSLLDYVPASYGGKIFLRGCGIPGNLFYI